MHCHAGVRGYRGCHHQPGWAEHRGTCRTAGVRGVHQRRATAAPFAQRYAAGFDLDYIEDQGLPAPIPLDRAADAELARLERESIQVAREEIAAGVRDPQGLRQQAYRIPGTAQLSGFADRIYDLPGFAQVDQLRESLLGLIGLGGGDGGFSQPVNVNIDGHSIGGTIEADNERGARATPAEGG